LRNQGLDFRSSEEGSLPVSFEVLP
jgi:hypothetical protein